ncbi:hypothetical protein CYMTET_54300 [Cymbomonas tetramitiformis]|uniref:Uncharacterized protein n=1 Tax=Cymbomonas tetramitiformis TaxID=36881 RepID=A0AAE0BGL1_9CHLO|nr:hypothetical protein CYMTET_54300 [Cymbomonas tetramitiformis]
MDDVVSTFQTAFDSEDDAAFAPLCQRHDQPLVRDDSEPFTYPETLDMGLRAQYVGVAHGESSATDMSDALAEARAGGVRCATICARRCTKEPALPAVSASDPARFEYPFDTTFMDKCFDQLSPAAEASLHARSIVHPLAVCDTELSVIDDVDSDSDCGSDGDVDSYEPAVVRCVRPVGAAG